MDQNRKTVFAKMSTQTLHQKLQLYRLKVKSILTDIRQNLQCQNDPLRKSQVNITDKVLRARCYAVQVQRIQQILMERKF